MKTLSARQLDLLDRIVGGTYRPASEDAVTIYALRSRGLATTTSSYAYATVQATEAGRALIADRDVPEADLRSEAATSDSSAMLDVPSSPAELVDRLAHADGGRLVVAHPAPEVRAAWRRLLHATRRKYPTVGGAVLRHTGRARGDLVIWFEQRVEADITPATVVAVEVPDRVRRPHPLVAALRSSTVGYSGWIDTHRMPDVAHVRIARSSKQRTIKILHALALEAQRRGHTVESRSEHRCPGGFGITIEGHWQEVTIVERYRRVPRVMTPRQEASRARGFDWVPRWDYEATGRLVLRHGHGSYGSVLAADRVRWKLEDRLGDVLDQLEQFAVVDEQHRLKRVEMQRLEAARRELHQQAAEDAWLLRERVRRLDEQIERWEHASRIRRFVQAARSSADVDESGQEWLDWANSHADSIDPVTAGLGSMTA